MEQVAGKFGDEVALDINTMTEAERAELDKRLAAASDANEINKSGVTRYDKEPSVTGQEKV